MQSQKADENYIGRAQSLINIANAYLSLNRTANSLVWPSRHRGWSALESLHVDSVDATNIHMNSKVVFQMNFKEPKNFQMHFSSEEHL